MDNIFTTEPNAEEAAQLQSLLDEAIIEMKRIRENMRRDDLEIEASQARVRRRLAHIDEVLAQIEAKYHD